MQTAAYVLKPCSQAFKADWLRLRMSLWPDTSDEKHNQEIAKLLANPDRFAQHMVWDGETPIGFIEMSLRHDYVVGTKTSPVAFMEGIYIVPEKRGHGIASLLLTQGESWAKQMGCSEIASDAEIDNAISRDFHKALGFAETKRVVFFKKVIN